MYFIFLTSLLNTLSHSSTSWDPLWSGRNCTSFWNTKMVDTYIPFVGTHRRAWCELPEAAVACRFNPAGVLSHLSGEERFRARYQQATLSEPTGTCPPHLTPSFASGLTIKLSVSAVCVFFLLSCKNSSHTRFRVCPTSLWPHLNDYT